MALVHCCFSTVAIFLFFTGLTSSNFISDDIFKPHAVIGRTLLQLNKACPVDFENQNYTIITSQCKGPRYPPKQCCSAFKEFACPYADELNDLNNVCSSTVFSYITPDTGNTGEISAISAEIDYTGLDYPSDPPGSSNSNPNKGSVVFKCCSSSALLLIVVISVLLF
ncbi:hypothetical protein MKX01_039213 [Papaver californicum]|nr:hypothetical protein MKX01_039213 [Papaver californicum]